MTLSQAALSVILLFSLYIFSNAWRIIQTGIENIVSMPVSLIRMDDKESLVLCI